MSIKTKFGTACVDGNGYLRISSSKEGNHSKSLHRLVFEDFYQIKLPPNIVIHHEDGNKLNNEIWNLVPMTNEEHSAMHHTGVVFTEERCKKISEAKKGFKFSDKSKEKMRQAKLGKPQTKEMMINRSKTNNRLGIFRVFISQNKTSKQGFDYCYNYTENGKRYELHSVDIFRLKDKVLAKGLDWIIVDEDKVKSNFDSVTADKLCGAIQ